MSASGARPVFEDPGEPGADVQVGLTALQDEVEQLRGALDSSRILGNAVGIVMSRLGCGPDEAWAVLVGASQDANVKARQVAEWMVAAISSGRADPDAARALRADLAVSVQLGVAAP